MGHRMGERPGAPAMAVVSPVASTAAAWIAQTLDGLHAATAHLARPGFLADRLRPVRRLRAPGHHRLHAVLASARVGRRGRCAGLGRSRPGAAVALVGAGRVTAGATARAARRIAVRACTRSTEQSLAGLRHATPRCPSCFEPGGDGQVAGHPRTGHDHAAHAAPTPGSFGSGDRRACKSCCQLESRRVRLLRRYSAMEVRNQLGEVWAII